MKKEQWDKIVSDLRSKGISNFTCPMCKKNQFNLLNDVLVLFPSKENRNISLSEYIPSAGIVCTNCGYISLFAINVASPTVFQELGKDE